MPALHFISPDSFEKALQEILQVEPEDRLLLRWGEGGQNIYAEGYDVELYEIEMETTSITGVAFRKVIIRDGDDEAFNKNVLIPFSERVQLKEQAIVEEVQARKGEMDERGFPTCDVLLWYDS